MEKPVESIVEESERIMISGTGEGNPIWRKAHFLKPTFNSTKGPVFEFPLDSLSSFQIPTAPKTWPFRVNFVGWRNPLKGWKNWVQKMCSLHLSTWEKAGIHESIMNSKLQIKRDDLLIIGLVEKWSNETKSFIFPWGEATITLEDVMVSWGYSVLGSPVNAPLESRELEKIKEKLENARKEICRTKSKKASQSLWMNRFMEGDGEFEHEAFLACWLSRFVFPITFDVISSCVFPIAIRLARGTRIALAPAVLAALYRDLGVLKHRINFSAKLGNSKNVDDVTLRAPFPLIQIWAWERFLKLGPRHPNVIKNGESRLARWHNLNSNVEEDVRLILNSAREAFDWRPYTKFVENWDFCFTKLYGENGLWLSVGSYLDEELKSFAKCLMVYELLGLDCVEWYFPNRVAMQFGLDQDIPGYPLVVQNADSIPLNKVKVYVPPSSFQGSVTVRYLEWWEQSMDRSKVHRTSSSNDVQVKRSREGLKRTRECNVSKESSKRMKVAIGFPRENSDESVQSLEDVQTLAEIFGFPQENSDESVNSLEDARTLSEIFRLGCKQDNLENGQELSQSSAMQRESNNSSFPPKRNAMGASNLEKMRKQKELNSSPFPPGFPPEPIAMEASVPIREEELTFSESSAMQKESNNSPFPPKRNAMGVSNPEKMRKQKELNSSLFPPGFPPEPISMEASVPIREEELTFSESLAMQKESNNSPFPPKRNAMGVSNPEKMRKQKELNSSPFPPGFPPKPIAMEASVRIREEELTFSEEFKSSGKQVGIDIGRGEDGEQTEGESQSLSSANDGDGRTFQCDSKCSELEIRFERLQRIFSRLKPAIVARHSRSQPKP